MCIRDRRKSLRLKALVAAGVAAAFSLCLAAGCAPAGGSADTDLADTGTADLAAAYPVHADNAAGGSGLAAYHTALGQECESCHQGDLAAQLEAAGEAVSYTHLDVYKRQSVDRFGDCASRGNWAKGQVATLSLLCSRIMLRRNDHFARQ